jgi:hypothetical protein
MGSQIQSGKTRKPAFKITVGGTEAIEEVVVCKYDGLQWQEIDVMENINRDRWEGGWQDTNFTGNGIYYVRVTQKDGENAWSSPIWVNHAD